jgi:deoxycytidylate deaminase
MTAKKQINYPYLPKGKEIKFVKPSNPFMLAAKKATEKTGCKKQPTGAVLVKDDKIVMTATNAGLTVSVCPRVLKGSKTGTDYHFCKENCKQEGHSEQQVVSKARAKKIDTNGADIYLWGHWWCCQPCWQAMIDGGIKNVYLEENADEKFSFSSTISKIYISGALTVQTGKKNMRKCYESIAALCSNFCSDVYVPHLAGTDPKDNPEISPAVVWKTDHRAIASSDLIIAYVGMPSLGVGAELEIARMSASDIIIWWYKGEKVTRMCLGNPSVKYAIEVENLIELEEKLRKILKEY